MSRRVANHFFYLYDDYDIPNRDDEDDEIIDDHIRDIKYRAPICMYFNSMKELESCNVVPKDVQVIVLKEDLESDELNEAAQLYYQKVTEVLDGWKVKYEIKEPENIKIVVLPANVEYTTQEVESIARATVKDNVDKEDKLKEKIKIHRFW